MGTATTIREIHKKTTDQSK